MYTLNNWMLLELTNNVAVGDIKNYPIQVKDNKTGKIETLVLKNYHFQTGKLIYINLETGILMDSKNTYRLGKPDREWLESKKNIDICKHYCGYESFSI